MFHDTINQFSPLFNPQELTERLVEAAEDGRIEKVKEILSTENGEKCINEAVDYKTAIEAAAENGHFDVVECLFQNGAELRKAVKLAEGKGHEGIVALLKDHWVSFSCLIAY